MVTLPRYRLLLSQGISTGHYNLHYADQWFASSKMHHIAEVQFFDNFTYYVEGIEGVAKVLKIKLNVNDLSRTSQVNEKLIVLSGVLIRESLGIEISDSVKHALLMVHDTKNPMAIKKLSCGRKAGKDINLECLTLRLRSSPPGTSPGNGLAD